MSRWSGQAPPAAAARGSWPSPGPQNRVPNLSQRLARFCRGLPVSRYLPGSGCSCSDIAPLKAYSLLIHPFSPSLLLMHFPFLCQFCSPSPFPSRWSSLSTHLSLSPTPSSCPVFSFPISPLLSPPAPQGSPLHLPAGPWGLFPREAWRCLCGALSMGQLPCAVLAALAAQEGREQGPGEGGGGGRKHLARQQAGERSGWQSVLAQRRDMGREQCRSLEPGGETR